MDNIENALPPGATPKDVADDVNIKASEGEFIFPANVVRYIGVSRLEQMVRKATKELEEMEKTSRIGGKIESLSDPNEELEEEDEEEIGDDEVPAFAEGGLVTSPTDPLSSVEWEYQTTPSGFKIRVPKIKGKYVSTNFKTGNGRGSMEKTGLDKDVKDWTVDDFTSFSKSVGTPKGRMGNKVANTLVAAATGPFKSVIDKAVASKEAGAKEALKTMAETGVDQAGNKLSPEDLAKVREAQALTTSPIEDTMAEKVAGAVAGGVQGGLVKTAVKTADALTGSKLSSAVEGIKDSAKKAIRGGIDTTYKERKEEKEKDKKGLVDRPSSNAVTTTTYDRHSNGALNVTGNADYDAEIEDSIGR